MATAARRARVPLKSVAVPNEHGAWAFLLEPALLGILLAPSWPGALLVVAALAALLAQHPLSLVLADKRRGKSYPRTSIALRFALGYGSVAAVSLVGAVLLTGNLGFLFPALLVAPLALVQLALDARNKGRSLTAELCGSAAISALAPTILLAGGSGTWPALALWLLLLLRNLSSILYVRTRLKFEYGRPASPAIPIAAQLVALALVVAVVLGGTLPWLTLAAFLVLVVRALLGLSRFRKPTAPKYVGMREMVFGLLLVGATVTGILLA